MHQKRLTSLLLAASVFSLLCTSCVLVNYSFTPPDTITNVSPIANNSAISFDLYHYRSREDRIAFADSFKEVLASAEVHETFWVNDTEISNTGPHVSIRVDRHTTETPRSWKSFILFLNMVTMKIVPYYGEPSGGGNIPWQSITGIDVTYVLCVDGTMKKDYPYPINMKVFSWILAPLAIPFLPSDGGIRNALTATARQFLRDAQRDGFL
jgi:hypothetical protein